MKQIMIISNSCQMRLVIVTFLGNMVCYKTHQTKKPNQTKLNNNNKTHPKKHQTKKNPKNEGKKREKLVVILWN